MSRDELRVIYVRSSATTKVKSETKVPVLAGMWFAMGPDGESYTLGNHRPDGWPPVAVFIRPGTMSRSAAARVLQSLALEMEHASAMH